MEWIEAKKMKNGYFHIHYGSISQIGKNKEELENTFNEYIQSLQRRLNPKQAAINDIMDMLGF